MEWTSSFPIEEFLLLSVGLTVKLLIFMLTGWSILGHHSWAQSSCGRFGRQGLRGACGGVVAPTARSATKQWMVRRSSLGENLVCWKWWVAWIYRWTSCWFVGVLMVQWSLEVWSQTRETWVKERVMSCHIGSKTPLSWCKGKVLPNHHPRCSSFGHHFFAKRPEWWSNAVIKGAEGGHCRKGWGALRGHVIPPNNGELWTFWARNFGCSRWFMGPNISEHDWLNILPWVIWGRRMMGRVALGKSVFQGALDIWRLYFSLLCQKSWVPEPASSESCVGSILKTIKILFSHVCLFLGSEVAAWSQVDRIGIRSRGFHCVESHAHL